MDTQLAPEKRAHMVLAAMTFEEKLSLVHGGGQANERAAGSLPEIPRLCLPSIGFSDGAAGVGNINVGVTAWPAPISRAAAFDRLAEHRLGVAVAHELRGKGNHVWLAPNVNIARYPLNGRTFEAYGEDPYLSGEIAVAAIRGAQSRHVITTVKHFIGNESEDNRAFEDSQIDNRTLHEIYLPPFEAAVKRGRSGGVMCAYNRVNGIYSCSNRELLTAELKQRMGFKGFVVSDWFEGAHLPTDANAGLDIEMAFPVAFAALGPAVQLGIVPMARLNDMVYRTLWAEFRFGVIDHPVGAPKAKVSTPSHRRLARQAAANGSVLLKNDDRMLPLTKRRVTIAVVGPVGPGGAGNVCTGGGSADVVCSNTTDPVAGLLELGNAVSPDALTAIRARAHRNGDKVLFADGSNTAAVTAVAGKADYVLAFGYYTEGEGQNRHSLNVDGDGDRYIAAAAAANKNTAVILEAGGPVVMPWLASVRAVLDTWYPGVEGPHAIADIIFGDRSPGGRLPITFPRTVADLPTADNLLHFDYSPIETYSERLEVGYRWYDAQKIKPLFPFGFGLGYTTFDYSKLRVRKTGNGTADVTFRVRNTGDRHGSTVPQVYVSFPRKAGEPPKQLRGFEKVTLEPGQVKTVKMRLGRRAFSYWNAGRSAWAFMPGKYRVRLAKSSDEIEGTRTLRWG
jgi:beta-glucosidase